MANEPMLTSIGGIRASMKTGSRGNLPAMSSAATTAIASIKLCSMRVNLSKAANLPMIIFLMQ